MNDIDERLHRLAAAIEAPAVPPAEDIGRGRRLLRRRRLATGGAALATLAVIGTGAVMAGQVGSPAADDTAQVGGGDGVGDPAPDTTPSVQPGESEVPQAKETGPALRMEALSNPEALRLYNDVLAEHIDPKRLHLEPYTKKTGNQQTGSLGSTVTSLGSKFGWRNAGQRGLGMLQVSVNAGWHGIYWMCGTSSQQTEGWTCHSSPAPDGTAEVARHGGVTEVAVEHADGEVVVLTVDALFGNNSTVPVSGMELAEADLIAAAADPRLSLPGDGVALPEPLDQDEFSAAGRSALLGSGERLGSADHGNRTQAFVRGRWLVDGADRGELLWDATVRTGPPPEGFGCLDVQFTRCVERTVDGKKVVVGYVRNKWGGGWQVHHPGPSYDVRVTFEPAGDAAYPLDRALAFVTYDRWQD